MAFAGIVFRRIRGHIVPMRAQTVDYKEVGKGAAITAGGLAAGAAGGKVISAAVNKASRMTHEARIQYKVGRSIIKDAAKQLPHVNVLNAAEKHMKSASRKRRIAKMIFRNRKLALGAIALGAGVAVAEGTHHILRGYDKDKNDGVIAEAGALAAGLTTGAFYYKGFGLPTHHAVANTINFVQGKSSKFKAGFMKKRGPI